MNEKELKGTGADPNESILVNIFNRNTKKRRQQSFKRKKLIGRTVIYTGIDGQRHFGSVDAFHIETGQIMLKTKDGIEPEANSDRLTFLE